MKALLYFQRLSDFGKYKVEKTEDYELARQDGMDLSYYEYIRVKATSSPNPSCVSKYSDTKLILYMKDHKKTWKSMAKLLRQDVDMSADEVVFIFSYHEFYKVDSIIHFVRKRSRQTPMNGEEKEKARQNMAKINSDKRHIIENFNQNLNENTLDDYLCVEVEKLWKNVDLTRIYS